MHYTEKQRKAAENLAVPGTTIKKALMDAGYSERTANNGVEAISQRVVRLIAKKGQRFVELGKIDVGTQENLVRGRLVYNTIRGTDQGAMSAKVLGSDKRCSMWQSDVQVGVIVVNPPSESRLSKLLEEE